MNTVTYSALINITITDFQPAHGGIGNSITAQLSPPQDISESPQPNMFQGDGQNLTVVVPDGFTGQVQLNLNLDDPKFILIGVAFTPSSGRLGRTEFPVIANNRCSHKSLLTITDICDPNESPINFNYGIVVQDVATGAIGIIDPRVETEN